MIIPIALPIILGPHHDRYLLGIGHGQYDQQQDILIVALYTWDLQVNLHIPQVRDSWACGTL